MFQRLFLPLRHSELLPSDSYTPTLHLVAYSVNQKGRSEPTVLEDIAINEAEKRTGRRAAKANTERNFFLEKVFALRHHSQHKFSCLQHCMKTHFCARHTTFLCVSTALLAVTYNKLLRHLIASACQTEEGIIRSRSREKAKNFKKRKENCSVESCLSPDSRVAQAKQ